MSAFLGMFSFLASFFRDVLVTQGKNDYCTNQSRTETLDWTKYKQQDLHECADKRFTVEFLLLFPILSCFKPFTFLFCLTKSLFNNVQEWISELRPDVWLNHTAWPKVWHPLLINRIGCTPNFSKGKSFNNDIQENSAPPTLWQRFCEVLFCSSMSMSRRTKWGPNDLLSGVKVPACTKLRSEPHWTLLGWFECWARPPSANISAWPSDALVSEWHQISRYDLTSGWRPIQWSWRKETSNFLSMPMVVFVKHLVRSSGVHEHIVQG